MTNDLERTDGEPAGLLANTSAVPELSKLVAVCGNQACPTVYRSDRGTLVVQGYAISAERAGVELPDGELLVEIPIELLTQAAGLVS